MIAVKELYVKKLHFFILGWKENIVDLSRDLDAVAEAIIAAHRLIEEHGTQEMKTLSRTLLLKVAQKIACRSIPTREARDPHFDGTD
ncbi:hypothetical protein MKK63_22485 [Methylobacterium sp. J-088]|uniref:hypothetical protein n=1 Tax=Methylobacterium sp. J-088 TaxID=2836664 RepID=UPI001FBA4FE8|nr:hypothetical protein [Methylobacterium sp. J-088]MCJ2065457.1 hypothetical protein [Methylobacterium sp. J-088]